MSYSYTPLPASHIRLLRSDISVSGTTSPALSFTVVTVPRDMAPSYTAVSYVWGSGPANQRINLNGFDFPIRQNLWSCLHDLLLLKMKSFRRIQWDHIWVDAICINQSDEREKNQQVRAMDKVYLNAVEVNAWLGLQLISNQIQWREDAVRALKFGGWVLSHNIFDVAQRPYWSRMWIVQEVLLAKRILLHIGQNNFEFEDLIIEVTKKPTSSRESLGRLLQYTGARGFGGFHRLPRPSLHDLLVRFGGGQCLDPRDKVFALMSLSDDYDQGMLKNCFPDYALTHDAVVAITLDHLRKHHIQGTIEPSHEIFDSLGVNRSLLTRKRLLAASKGLPIYSDLALTNQNGFREIDFYETEDAWFDAQASGVVRTSIIYKVKDSMWWLVTYGGLLTMRRILLVVVAYVLSSHFAEWHWDIGKIWKTYRDTACRLLKGIKFA